MADTNPPISAFVAYSKMRQSSANAFSSKPAKKRHSSVSVSVQKKSRKRSASLGDIFPNNNKGKKTPKVTKSAAKKFSNGTTAKTVSKSATPNISTETSPRKSNAAAKIATSKSEKNLKLKNKILRSSDSNPGSKVAVKKNIPIVNSASKKKAGKKSTSKVEENKVELDSDDDADVMDDSELVESEEEEEDEEDVEEGEEEVDDEEEEEEEEKEAELLTSSIDEGRKLFQWLISPFEIDPFYKTSWEIAPLYIKRNTPGYYKHLISTPIIDSILRNYYMQYTKNVDITSYTDGKRETHNPIGRALPSVVWDYYMNGCSIRLLNPQTFIPKLHVLNATLQEYFGCFVGANAYLTPPNSQGFAPHYDDIEAFILQIEGRKKWRLYKPRTDDELLPRFSSRNFEQSEIGEPIMEIILEAGDLLYFPRGTIHQAETIGDAHSLHVTLSVFQKNSWGDFFEKLVPVTLEKAITTDVEFREGLPLDYLQHVGLAHVKKDSVDRTKFIRRAKYLLSKLVQYIDTDKAADEMAKKHIHDFLPPVLTEEEKECSVYQDGERMTRGGKVVNRVEIEPDTKIKLVKAQCIRLVQEDESFRVYYSNENSKEYHELEPQFLEVSQDLAPAIEAIIQEYPNYIKVEDLPIDEEDSKIQVVKDLWEKGIVITDQPLGTLE